jgi:hypothetical protein
MVKGIFPLLNLALQLSFIVKAFTESIKMSSSVVSINSLERVKVYRESKVVAPQGDPLVLRIFVIFTNLEREMPVS